MAEDFIRDLYTEPELDELDLSGFKVRKGEHYKIVVGKYALYVEITKITPTRLFGIDVYGNMVMVKVPNIIMISRLTPDNFYSKKLARMRRKEEEKAEEKGEETG